MKHSRTGPPARDLACQALGHGIAHGGYLFLLADAAFAYASNPHGPVAVAQSAQITFPRPAAVGTSLLAEAVERARHGRFGVYDVTVREEGGSAVAISRGHSVLLIPGGGPATGLDGDEPAGIKDIDRY
jgi:acyl-CoA thioesterase